MPTLVFGADGRLRQRRLLWDASQHTRKLALLPLDALERASKIRLLHCLQDAVEIEPGTTVRAIFEALAPWSLQIGALSKMDFSAFLQEARKPYQASGDHDAFQAVKIFSQTDILPHLSWDQPDQEVSLPGRPEVKRLIRGKPQKTPMRYWKNAWSYQGLYVHPQPDVEGVWHHHGSLDYLPLSAWSGLPVHLSSNMAVIDQTFASPFSESPEAFLNPHHPQVGCVDGKYITHMQAPTPTLWDSILQGFLAEVGFCGTPNHRDQALQRLQTKVLGDVLLDTPEHNLQLLEAVQKVDASGTKVLV